MKPKEFTIEWRRPDELTPYVKNAKVHTTEQIDKIAGQIAAFGFDQPIVVDKEGVIIKGHGRREAAIRLGLEKVPVIVQDLDEYQAMAARIADNKIAETSWDKDLLRFDIHTLDSMNFDLALTGFDASQFADLMAPIVDLPPPGEGAKTPGGEEVYTTKITSPVYQPKGLKPPIEDLYSLEKAKELLSEIETSKLPESEKEFLRFAAYRHVVFNYENIAEFYAHASKETQALMENSALVIIDFNKAIEKGFVKLAQAIADSYQNQGESSDDNE